MNSINFNYFGASYHALVDSLRSCPQEFIEKFYSNTLKICILYAYHLAMWISDHFCGILFDYFLAILSS
jgi:hypothetical protein